MANLLLCWGPAQGCVDTVDGAQSNPGRVRRAGAQDMGPHSPLRPEAIKPNDAVKGILQVDVWSEQAFCWTTPITVDRRICRTLAKSAQSGLHRSAGFMRVVLGFVPIDGAFSLRKHACAHLETPEVEPFRRQMRSEAIDQRNK